MAKRETKTKLERDIVVERVQTGVRMEKRLLKVLKTAVSAEEMPAALGDIFSPLFGFEFFEKDPETYIKKLDG